MALLRCLFVMPVPFVGSLAVLTHRHHLSASTISTAASSIARMRCSRSASALTRRRRLFAARHRSEQADVCRPVVGWLQTGQGRNASWDATTRALGAARSVFFGKQALGTGGAPFRRF